MKLRGTATDKLADVIQMLLFVQRTGTLLVQREGPGNLLEEGSILFQEGQIVDATVANLRGADAMKKLSTWGQCYFVFQASPANSAHPMPQVRPNAGYSPVQREVGGSFDPASAVIPYRVQHFQHGLPDFGGLGLSRAHRQLYMLVDGQRSIDVLAKLIGRNPQEALSLLNDLENLGLLRRL